MSFLKLLLSFAPWIPFLILARGSLFMLEVGLLVALALVIVMGVTRLHRGIILWVGLLFFSLASVAVIAFHSMWTVRYLGVLANGALAAGSWFTIAVGKPFTLDYAKAQTDPSLWQEPLFIRTNFIITAVWATAFTVNAVLAWGKAERFVLSDLGYEVLSYVFLIGAAGFTSWYPGYVRRTSITDRH